MPIVFGLKSVPAGWQSCATHDGEETTFGPIYRKSTDLWAWQRESKEFSDVVAAQSVDEALTIAAAIPQTYTF